MRFGRQVDASCTPSWCILPVQCMLVGCLSHCSPRSKCLCSSNSLRLSQNPSVSYWHCVSMMFGLLILVNGLPARPCPGTLLPNATAKLQHLQSDSKFSPKLSLFFPFLTFGRSFFTFHLRLAGNCRIGKKLPGMPSARPSGTLIPDVPSPTRSLSERSGERNFDSEIKLGNYIEFGPKIMIRFAS